MMEQIINKSLKSGVVVDIKICSLFFVVFLCIILIPVESIAQHNCKSYDEILDGMVTRLFAAPRHQDFRESEFPATLHSVSKSEVRRLNYPEEQGVCDTILNKIYGDDPVKGPPTHHALYKVKDHYFMVIYKYYTASDGTQLIEDPTVGGLFNPQFKRIGLVMM